MFLKLLFAVSFSDLYIYLMCCGVMLLLLIIYICIYMCVSCILINISSVTSEYSINISLILLRLNNFEEHVADSSQPTFLWKRQLFFAETFVINSMAYHSNSKSN